MWASGGETKEEKISVDTLENHVMDTHMQLVTVRYNSNSVSPPQWVWARQGLEQELNSYVHICTYLVLSLNSLTVLILQRITYLSNRLTILTSKLGQTNKHYVNQLTPNIGDNLRQFREETQFLDHRVCSGLYLLYGPYLLAAPYLSAPGM